jgi:hypothetical protein
MSIGYDRVFPDDNRANSQWHQLRQDKENEMACPRCGNGPCLGQAASTHVSSRPVSSAGGGSYSGFVTNKPAEDNRPGRHYADQGFRMESRGIKDSNGSLVGKTTTIYDPHTNRVVEAKSQKRSFLSTLFGLK